MYKYEYEAGFKKVEGLLSLEQVSIRLMTTK